MKQIKNAFVSVFINNKYINISPRESRSSLPFHFYLAFERKKPFFYISFFTVAGALAIAQARGPWLGAAAGFLLYAVLLIRSGRLHGKKIWIIPLLCLVLIFALILLHSFVDLPFITRFLSIFRDMKAFLIHGFDATKAGSHRVFVWKKALGIVKHSLDRKSVV